MPRSFPRPARASLLKGSRKRSGATRRRSWCRAIDSVTHLLIESLNNTIESMNYLNNGSMYQCINESIAQMKLTLTIITLLLFAPAATARDEITKELITSNGKTRAYYLYVPPTVNTTAKA